MHPHYVARTVLLIGITACAALRVWAAPTPDYRRAVEADWRRQEQRLGREIASPAAIDAALSRAERLWQALERLTGHPDRLAQQRMLTQLIGHVDGSRGVAARESLYYKIRWMTRDAALSNPLVAGKPLVFMKRRRFVSQMLHEYLGYYYDYADIVGGGVYALTAPGESFEAHDLVAGRLPKGNYTTLSLSYDASTLWFAFCSRGEGKPGYYSPQRRCFHLFSMRADGSGLRQVTFGPDDDFDPCPLPDGGVAFMSTRRGGFGRCHNPWEPLPAYTLHRMEPDGSRLRTLSFHETNQWHPSVGNDGRILYSRWDYVDRSAANFHGIWSSNPDGSAAHVLFGNATERINACYQPRAVPGSRRIVMVAGAHHAVVGGSLVLVDPQRVRLDPRTGQDEFSAVERLTPEVCFPEAPNWPKSFYHAPWPLSEDFYLVGFSFDPLGGCSAGTNQDSETGLYYFDRFGNLELLYREPGISAMYPIPLAPRPTPPIVPVSVDPQLQDEGELLLADVRRSLFPLPADRPIRSLRVYQVLPKTETHVANQPRIGYANAESARMLLGDVPVEPDGSAFFRVPARKPLYFQAVDASGRAVQTMHSAVYMQPGERRSCVGCHEPPHTAAALTPSAALRRPASRIVPGPDGTRPFSFPLLVQPALERHCVRCHDGGPTPAGKLAMTAAPQGEFTASYENLRRHVRWYEWGGNSIAHLATPPGRGGADESPLWKVLDDANHKPHVRLSDDDRRRITLWLDANAPFYGVYDSPARAAQRRGDRVPEPVVQ